jgi:UDP-N-acetylmuramoyl-tripeptide--D-alanyl-D-alanine ligase
MNDGTYTLSEIAAVVGAEEGPASTNETVVSAYSLDSRSIRPGELFVAVKGERFDGADYVDAALSRGAAGALVAVGSKAQVKGSHAGLVWVADVPVALQALAAHHRRNIPIPMVAVTGTNGKTTTKEVIAHVLAAHLPVCYSVGNLNSQLGMPLTLLNNLRPTHRAGVFEVGMSAPGEIARLCRILQPTHGVVTNVGAAHTEFLGSVENVFRAKSELPDSLPKDGRLYLNAECGYHGRMRSNYKGISRVVSVRDTNADMFLEVDSADLLGTRGRVRVDGGWHSFAIPIPGRHMIYPGLFALSVCRDLGLDLATSLRALASSTPAKHRMQVFARGALTILDDCYNANPPSTLALLDFVRDVSHAGRKVLVLGDMLELGDLGRSSHAKVLEQAVGDERFNRIFVVGSLYREALADVPATQGALASGRLSQWDGAAPLLPSLRDALKDGDLLVLKASRGIGLDKLIDAL